MMRSQFVNNSFLYTVLQSDSPDLYNFFLDVCQPTECILNKFLTFDRCVTILENCFLYSLNFTRMTDIICSNLIDGKYTEEFFCYGEKYPQTCTVLLFYSFGKWDLFEKLIEMGGDINAFTAKRCLLFNAIYKHDPEAFEYISNHPDFDKNKSLVLQRCLEIHCPLIRCIDSREEPLFDFLSRTNSSEGSTVGKYLFKDLFLKFPSLRKFITMTMIEKYQKSSKYDVLKIFVENYQEVIDKAVLKGFFENLLRVLLYFFVSCGFYDERCIPYQKCLEFYEMLCSPKYLGFVCNIEKVRRDSARVFIQIRHYNEVIKKESKSIADEILKAPPSHVPNWKDSDRVIDLYVNVIFNLLDRDFDFDKGANIIASFSDYYINKKSENFPETGTFILLENFVIPLNNPYVNEFIARSKAFDDNYVMSRIKDKLPLNVCMNMLKHCPENSTQRKYIMELLNE